MNLSKIPEHMREGVLDYVNHGTPPGGFLRAILENNFVDTWIAHQGLENAQR